ncbi:MAG: BamA/TamA family outer membrane protein [Rhodothermales bacterium]|nr:BamA/TamA family outer membrane protein [Rhodothermales bacterium]
MRYSIGLKVIFFVLIACAFSLEATAQYGYYFGRNKIQYEDFDWAVLKTEHFDVYYYPEMLELAEHGAAFAEEAYDELQNKFHFGLNNRVPLIFYSSNLHFKQTNVTPGHIPDGVGGFFEFLKGRVVIPANGNLHQFRRVVRHELVHVFTFNKVLRVMRDYRIPQDRFLPLWFTEGLAEYWSGEPDHSHEMVIRDALVSNYLTPLENMYRINGSFVMYKQGEAICRFIGEEYGEEYLLELIDNFWKEFDFRRVMSDVLREDFKVISAKWEAWLKAQYYPEFEDIQIPSLMAGAVAARGFNSKPEAYSGKDGSTRVFFVSNRDGYSSVFEVPVDSNYTPLDKPRALIKGGRGDKFEAFHLFESRISISEDGKLAFVTKSGEKDVIHIYDVVADRMITTYAFEELIAVYSPDWSPDGKQLVFSSIDRAGFSDLYIFSTESGLLRRVTDDHYDDRDPAWSPDGTRIAFSSDRTAVGLNGSYNLFTYDNLDGQIRYITYGERNDMSPRWSPDGRHLVFTSTSRGSGGKFSAQNVWVADVPTTVPESPAVATSSADLGGLSYGTTTYIRQLTNLSAAAFDPSWTEDNQLVFTAFESFRFSIRTMAGIDSLVAEPLELKTVNLAQSDTTWSFETLGVDAGAEKFPYKKRYKLDIAQGQVSQSAVLGTVGGAVLAFSDMLGDDYLYLSILNTADRSSDFLRSLSFSLTRVQLHRRANIAYGIYRFSGRRYDITDPDADATFPIFFETLYGGVTGVSYPLSKFRRLDINTSLTWSNKDLQIGPERKALLLSNSVSLVHDNSLYSLNGPVNGWRAGLTAAYTTDVKNSNVSYFTLQADVRRYFRIVPGVTFATRGVGRINDGREARLFILGGSWDLRGYRLFTVRGQKMWFTSNELRFPIVNAPYLIAPVLAPFGIVNLRGALFFDAAHAWNDDYSTIQRQINAGETLGATGLGLRVNIFGGFVLRYDLGYRYRNGFKDRDKFFRQFFFGFDF